MFVARACPLPLSDYPDDYPLALRRVLSARRIDCASLKKPLASLIRDSELPHAGTSAKLIADAIDANARIVIAGDYDADGATSTALMYLFLTAVGADVHFAIPNRQVHGYGLSANFLQSVVLPLAPKLIITVDNGIKSFEAVELARAQGIDIIITDHHLPSDALPDANVIVNPNVATQDDALKHLAGVGVAFYVLLALRRELVAREHPQIANVSMADYLDLVALGTVADCVTLDYNNRVLVANGLARIQSGRASVGMNALVTAVQKHAEALTSTDMAFYLAPMLNSAGRLGDMRIGVECLLATSERMAADLANYLCDLNRQRKVLENQSRVDAEFIINELSDIDVREHGICVFDSAWHEGVIGIVASRLVDTYQQPALVFAPSQDANILKGSARSLAGVHLPDLFSELATDLPDIVLGFGGHAVASGMSIRADGFAEFQRLFHEKTQRVREDKVVHCDGELEGDEFSVGFARTLKSADVWGQGNPEPSFVNTFEVKSVKLVGDNHAKCLLIEPSSGNIFEAMAFSQFETWSELVSSYQRVAYRIDVNEWRGVEKLQLFIDATMPASAPATLEMWA